MSNTVDDILNELDFWTLDGDTVDTMATSVNLNGENSMLCFVRRLAEARRRSKQPDTNTHKEPTP